MKSTILAATLAASAATVTCTAIAAPIVVLPAAEYRIQGLDVYKGDPTITNNRGSDGTPYPLFRPGTYTSSGDVRANETSYHGEAKLSLSNDNWGTVSASAKSQQFTAGTSGGLFYYFTVLGPDADYVPVRISGSGSASAGGPNGFANSHAEMRINYVDGASNVRSSVLEAFDPGEHHTFSDVINVKPNSNARTGAPNVSLFAQAGVGNNDYSNLGAYAGEASALIDPLISIADPALARLYTIEIGLSDIVLVPPVSAVPLPTSLPLLAMAVLAAGVASCSRRRSVRHA